MQEILGTHVHDTPLTLNLSSLFCLLMHTINHLSSNRQVLLGVPQCHSTCSAITKLKKISAVPLTQVDTFVAQSFKSCVLRKPIKETYGAMHKLTVYATKGCGD